MKSAFRSTRASWQAILVQMLLWFPVYGMPKTVREKNIIFNVIKYFEYEKEHHGKQKFRPNAVMRKAAEATGVPL